jgi:hypothetical protein
MRFWPIRPEMGVSSAGIALEVANLDDDACQRLRDVDRVSRIRGRPFLGLGAGRLAFFSSRRSRLVPKHVRRKRVVLNYHAFGELQSAVLNSRLDLLTKDITVVSKMRI